ncbi:hypothetical protein SDC9_117333 [bioreactor metagenome]|uniref:Uncharacterized protein n=1 Tax=bioreactor metagenome TaxID=1076179 RepID=A0A645BZ50_9ZZZZ
MNLTVNMDKKSIQTEPIKRLMIQGEALADVVSLTLPLEYGDIDLSLLNYSIRGTSEDAETTVTQALSKSVTESAVVLECAISSAFTAIPGELKLVLVGSDEAGDTIIKCDGESVYVRSDPSIAGFATAPVNAYEQLLAQINYQIAHMQIIRILGTYATLSALTSGVSSPNIGDMYNVGAAAPYNVYVWTGSWVSLGQLKGDKGDPGGTKTLLWAGAWSSGNITVPNFDQYNLFEIFSTASATAMIVAAHNGYLRGFGGFTTGNAAANQYIFFFAATYTGTTLTFGYCNSNNAPTVGKEIAAIYGLK